MQERLSDFYIKIELQNSIERNYLKVQIIEYSSFLKGDLDEVLSNISLKDVNDRIFHRVNNSEKMMLIKE